jgi:hypothetical protein
MSNSTSRRVEALRRCPSPPGLTNSISSLQGGKGNSPKTHARTHTRRNWRCSFFKRLGYYVHLNANDVRMKEILERLAMKILRLVPRKTKLLAHNHH